MSERTDAIKAQVDQLAAVLDSVPVGRAWIDFNEHEIKVWVAQSFPAVRVNCRQQRDRASGPQEAA